MPLIRHRNRGDVDAGGCGLCKPRHKREEDTVPVDFQAVEGLADFLDELEDGHAHTPAEDWTFGA